jgi:hypothetical protein
MENTNKKKKERKQQFFYCPILMSVDYVNFKSAEESQFSRGLLSLSSLLPPSRKHRPVTSKRSGYFPSELLQPRDQIVSFSNNFERRAESIKLREKKIMHKAEGKDVKSQNKRKFPL